MSTEQKERHGRKRPESEKRGSRKSKNDPAGQGQERGLVARRGDGRWHCGSRRQAGGGSSAAVMTVVLSWAALRAGVQAFHLTRRCQLRRLLTDLCEALGALRQTFWLDFGGLLGIYREGDLLLTDSDIDLAVWDADWPALEAGLRKALPGYSMARLVPSEDPSATFLRLYCPLGMADVFGARDVGGGRVLVDCGHGSDAMAVRADSVFPVGRLSWRGRAIPVPGDVEAMLAQRYGPTWRQPRYLDKGADTVEHNKWHNKLMRALAYTGIRL